MARPKFEINEDIIKKAESLAANGLTKEQIADCLGICYMTLNRQEKANSEFCDDIKRGQSKGIGMMANNLVKLAKGGNAAANIFWLKARAKWKEGDDDIADMMAKAEKTLAEVKEIANKCLQNLPK